MTDEEYIKHVKDMFDEMTLNVPQSDGSDMPPNASIYYSLGLEIQHISEDTY